MTDVFTIRPQRRAPSAALVPYVLITFAIAWGIIGLYNLSPGAGRRLVWRDHRHTPALCHGHVGPRLCGIRRGVFLWRRRRTQGISHAPRSLAMFNRVGRVSADRGAVDLRGGALVKGTLTDPLPFDSLGSALALMGFMLFLGPVEEFGWRGVAQPLLQRHVAPIWAGLLIGATWGFWHFPAFYLSGTVYTDWSFLPFFIGNVTLAVIVTPLFNVSRGSILLPALFHFQLINPLWPDAQPYDTWFFVLVAVVVVWVNRKTMFTREGAVTEVIPGSGG